MSPCHICHVALYRQATQSQWLATLGSTTVFTCLFSDSQLENVPDLKSTGLPLVTLFAALALASWMWSYISGPTLLHCAHCPTPRIDAVAVKSVAKQSNIMQLVLAANLAPNFLQTTETHRPIIQPTLPPNITICTNGVGHVPEHISQPTPPTSTPNIISIIMVRVGWLNDVLFYHKSELLSQVKNIY